MESEQLRSALSEWMKGLTNVALYHLVKRSGKLQPAARVELERRNVGLAEARAMRRPPWTRGDR